MRPTLHDVLRSNVDDITANRGGRVESKGLVFVDSESVQFALVDGSHRQLCLTQRH